MIDRTRTELANRPFVTYIASAQNKFDTDYSEFTVRNM
jgi:hypothetical protein